MPLTPLGLHEIEQVEQSVEIVAIVEYGFLNRFAYSLACGKVDDAFDAGIVGKQFLHGSEVGAVGLYKSRTLAGDFLYAVEHFNIGVGEIVDNDNVISCILKLDCCMRADVTGAAGDQYSFFAHDLDLLFLMFWFYTANLVIYSSVYKFFLIKILYIRPNNR